MNIIDFFNKHPYIARIIYSVIAICISIIIYKILSFVLLNGMDKENSKKNNKKVKTYIKLIKNTLKYILIIITAIVLLQINGVNVSSLVAGLGIVGIVLGLAIQDWLKDIIRGNSIISDGYFAVGDAILYNNIEGLVTEIGLKTTKIRDIKTSNIVSIANRKIEEVQIISDCLYVTIPFPYEVPLKDAEKITNEIIDHVKKESEIKEINNLGVTELDSSSILHLVEIKCDPLVKRRNRRILLKTILKVFENNNIQVPYNQIDVHQK